MQNLIKIEKLNKLSETDFKEIYEIEKLSFSDPWTEGMFRVEENEHIVVAEIEGKIEGYICYMTVLDECHILNVAVNPNLRGKGIASKMMEFLINPQNGCFYYLEVRKTNENAIKLYEKFGFQQIGIRPKYYQNNEDALVFMKGINE